MALGLVGLVIAAALGGVALFRANLPQTTGTLALPALSAPVDVARDRLGVPTIRAQTEADAFRALGYVHAQDRFLQMEFMRRLGAGRLSEVLGGMTLDVDRWSRTLGLYRRAEQSFAALGPEAQAALVAYAEGVSAWIAEGDAALPPALAVLGVEPEPWRPADSLVWQRLMAFRLAGNWQDEAERARLLANGLPPDRLADLIGATATVDGPVTVPVPVRQALLPPAPPPALASTLASNVWTVAPERSTTGGALLANDPHLGYDIPILWYLARIETPAWRMTGATVPGVPFPLIGHNDRIGWGITTTHADTKDLFVETLAGEGESYLTPDGPQAFDTREEVIAVRGGDPVTLTVRESRHGPIVGDLRGMSGVAAGGEAVALAATALRPQDTTAEALHRLSHAGNRADFREALRLFQAPMQNIFFADAAGDTGFIAAGLVPVRKAGNGMLPVPGADGTHDWTGFVPFESLPMAFAPSSGTLLNANNRVVTEEYPHLITADWPPPWRAIRGEEMLAAAERLGPEDMVAMQMDTVSVMARRLLPPLLAALPETPETAEARALLAAWDHRLDADRPEPLLFNAWLLEAETALVIDELQGRGGDWRENNERLLAAAVAEKPWWCDDKRTAETESCAALLDSALKSALETLRSRHGDDMTAWQWGEAHRADFGHQLYGRIPGLGSLFDRRPPVSGGNHSLQRAGFWSGDAATGFDAVHGAGLRMVLDMSDPHRRSRFVIATGQSENPLSRHYDDMLALWMNGELQALDGEPVSVLRLQP